MIDERLENLASLYALDLLDGAERTEFETALAGSPELRQLVKELRDSAASLAHLAPAAEPSPALKQRLLATVAARTPPAAENIVAVNFLWSAALPWAMAAGFALVGVWLGSKYTAVRTENELLSQRAALAEVTAKSATTQIQLERILSHGVAQQYEALKSETAQQVADALAREAHARTELAAATKAAQNEANLAQLKIATLVSMLNNSPKALAVAVWDPLHQHGVLTVDRMPPNPADRRYELWVIDGKPISAGVFTVGEDGRARIDFKPVAPVSKATKFAVSREANDGLPAHATPGEVIMLSE